MLPSSSDGEEDFDILKPTLWPVESCFLMGVRGSFVYPWHTPDASVYEVHCHQCFLFGETRIASVYEMCIQWRLYEAMRIWKLKVPLGIGRNLFCLTFLP